MTAVPDGAIADRGIDVLVVTSDACHFCEMAHLVIEGLSAEYPIRSRLTPSIGHMAWESGLPWTMSLSSMGRI